MTNTKTNLRKAAVLLRSLDADTAATMLAQLSAEEAAAIREAIRALGPMDPDEQAAVAADFRRARPQGSDDSNYTSINNGGVELALSEAVNRDRPAEYQPSRVTANRFEFLHGAPTSALVPFLTREHAQTIAVVLSHLAPARAAEVLAALPAKLQADTMERLSGLGETDPASVTALEQELAAWLAKRGARRSDKSRGSDTVATILAATDAKTRDGILSNLKSQKSELADRIAPVRNAAIQSPKTHTSTEKSPSRAAQESTIATPAPQRSAASSLPPQRINSAPLPTIDFDHLIHLDNRALASVLRDVNANVLALALVGSRDDLVDRICEQMPKRTAREFRRELRRMGPTRLSDVEGAQRAVAAFAAQHIANRGRRLAVAS